MNNNDTNFVIHLTLEKLFTIIVFLTLILLGSIGFDKLGFEIPILRQVTGFVYSIFVPGFLLLGILRINNLSTTEAILYSVGLSLSFLMFMGIIVNTFYPFIGISKPISDIPLVITLCITILFLYLQYYQQNKNFARFFRINIEQPLFLPTLSLSLLPLSAILGTYLLNFYNNNNVLLIIFIIISIIPILVANNKIPDEKLGFAIFTIAISLVLYNSLFGTYMRYTDNVAEIYISKLVTKNGIWNPSLSVAYNNVLGIVMLLPAFHEIFNMDFVFIYKIVIPSLSAFIPLGLYEVFRRKSNYKIALFSSFFFISLFSYFTWSSITMKMVSVGLFLMLLMLLMTDTKMNPLRKRLLEIIFSFSMITCHYGTSIIFMFSLIITLILLFLLKNYRKTELLNSITPNFVILYVALCIVWYIYYSNSIFIEIVNIGNRFVSSILTKFLFPESYGTQLLFGNFPLHLEFLRSLYIISGIFIFVGLIFRCYVAVRNNSLDEYITISFVFFLFLILPYIFGGIYGGRIWYICSFFLAPFCITGIIELFKQLNKFFTNDTTKKGMIFTGVFLCIFFLFNSGFAAEVLWKNNLGASIYVSAPRILSEGSIEEKEYLDKVHLTVLDVKSAEWLAENMEETGKIFSGVNAENNLRVSGLTPGYVYRDKIGSSNIFHLTNRTKIRASIKSYIYLSEFNMNTGKIKTCTKGPRQWATFSEHFDIKEISKEINISNKIYTNGGSEIYFKD